MPLTQQRRREVENAIRRAAQGREPTTINFGDAPVSTQSNVTGQLSEIARLTVPQGTAWWLPPDHRIVLYIKNHEQFTSDGMAGNDEQFSLSEDFVDSPTVSDPDTSQTAGGSEVAASGDADAVLYDAGTQQAFSAVDFSNDTVNYSDAQTGSTIDVYYLFQAANQIVGKKHSANDVVQEEVFATDLRRVHNSNLFNKNQQLTYRTDEVLLPEEALVVYIDTSVDLTNWDASDAYPYFSFPVVPVSTSDVTMPA